MLIITCENDCKVVLMEGNTFLTHVLLQNKIGSSQSLLAGNNSVFGKINRYIHQLIDTNLKAGKIENIILSVIICVTQHSKTLAKSNNLMMPTSYSSTPPPPPPITHPRKMASPSHRALLPTLTPCPTLRLYSIQFLTADVIFRSNRLFQTF